MTGADRMAQPAIPGDDDYYKVLGVSPTVSQEALKVAYRSLIKKHHPDVRVAKQGDETARRINEAYTALRDPIARKRYDMDRRERLRAQIIFPPRPQSSPGWDVEYQETRSLRTPGNGHISMLLIVLLMVLISTGVTISFIFSDVFDGTLDTLLSGSNSDDGSDITGPLADRAAPAPRMDDIEAGAFAFLDVLQRTGMSGARGFSIRCHQQVNRTPSWRKADICASFDYAAAYVDSERSRLIAHLPDPYFDSVIEHEERYYAPVGAKAFSTLARLKEMRGTIEFNIAEGSATRFAPTRSE